MLLGVVLAGSASACDQQAAGLEVPPGFCATLFADELGQARNLAVAPDGDVYVNTGDEIIALRDAQGSGRADMIRHFGAAQPDEKTGGGSGIAVSGDSLYAESAGSIVRYRLRGGALVPQGAPEVVLSGLPSQATNAAHSFAIAPNAELFVNSGSLTDSCRSVEPCPELERRAGIWLYSAEKMSQRFSPAERYATGARNAMALALHPNGLLYATLPERDGEVFTRVQALDDFGWPYCYYAPGEGGYVLAPEYGGDGSKQSECIAQNHPRIVFPPHWVPSAMTFYSAPAFPGKYHDGAFIAFHVAEGSLVAFVPFAEDRAAGDYQVFAFARAGRPTGVAAGPDGALYVSDDLGGRLWKITTEGDEL